MTDEGLFCFLKCSSMSPISVILSFSFIDQMKLPLVELLCRSCTGEAVLVELH